MAIGPEDRRKLLTPVGMIIFTSLLLLVVFGSLRTDRPLALSWLLPAALGSAIGVLPIVIGLSLWAWCIVLGRF